jgi:hypothetical protein
MEAQISPSLIIKTMVTLLACVISGCVPTIVQRVYSGPELPKESVAIITQECGVATAFVDEKFLPDYSQGRCGGSSLSNIRLHVLPGLHKIEVHYRGSVSLSHTISSSYPIPLEFEAKAGHTYLIHSNRRFMGRKQGYSWQPSIEDVTGK